MPLDQTAELYSDRSELLKGYKKISLTQEELDRLIIVPGIYERIRSFGASSREELIFVFNKNAAMVQHHLEQIREQLSAQGSASEILETASS